MQFYCNIELQIFKLFVRPNMKPKCLQTLKEIKMTAGPILVLSSDWIVLVQRVASSSPESSSRFAPWS